MNNNYRKPTPYSNMPKGGLPKRYATAAVVLGGGAILGSSYLMNAHSSMPTNTGTAFTNNGKQYYIPGDSRRAVYPSKEACMQDVPWDRQAECEPTSNYAGGGSGRGGGGWYGPVYSPRDTYQPNSQYPTEKADSTNVGKQLPKGANTSGFGDNGKALTGSKGG